MRISDWSSDVCSSDLLAAIRAQHPAVGVVVVSANDDPQVIRRALDHGAAGFIPKSADLDSLRDAVLSVLGGQPWLPDALRNAVAMTRSQQRDTDLARSEEHTSELQSLMRLSYAVFRLKTKNSTTHNQKRQ